MQPRTVGKKRKCDVDLDAERSLHSSFVTAANSISHLFTHAVQQQRKCSAAASRQTLERIMCFLLRDYHSAEVIPRHELLQFLQQEYENIEGAEHLPHQFPVPVFPVVSQGNGDSEVPLEANAKARSAQFSLPRRNGPVSMDTVDMHDA